jgi:hypothetical protein
MSTQYGGYTPPTPGYWADGYYSTNYPWLAGDNNTGTYWNKGTLPAYFYIEFGNFKDYVIDRLEAYNTAHNNHVKTFDISGGVHNNDGTITWTVIATGVEFGSSLTWGVATFTNTTAYRYYRIKVTAIRSGTTYPRIFEIKYMGPDGQNPVPSLSKLTTGTETYTDSGHVTTHEFALAFDGDDATYFQQGGSNQWVKVDFGEGNGQVATKWVFYQIQTNNYYGPEGFSVHGSNNGSDWTELLAGTNEQKSGHYHEFTWANTTTYRYYRLTFSLAASYWYIGTSDLYGTIEDPDPPANCLSPTSCEALPYVPPDPPADCRSSTRCEAIPGFCEPARSETTCETITLPRPSDCRSLTTAQALLEAPPNTCVSRTTCQPIILDGGDFFLTL